MLNDVNLFARCSFYAAIKFFSNADPRTGSLPVRIKFLPVFKII